MTATGQSFRTWYLAFTEEVAAEYWWLRFLKREFRHCLCFAQTGPTVTVFEPLYHHFHIESYYNEANPFGAMSAEEVACAWVDLGYIVVEMKVEVNEEEAMRRWQNLFPTCVTLTKIITGIKGFAFTPYQLYKLTIKQGGILIDHDERRRRLMGFAKKPKAPDTSAQQASLKKQEEDAKKEAQEQATEVQESLTKRRRKQRGRLSLIANEGGELGVQSSLGT